MWTDERIEAAKKMRLDDGMSAAEIAKKLGNVTRNAVLGKLTRMGVMAPVKSADPMLDKKRTGQAAINGFKTQPMPKLREIKHVGEPISIIELTRSTCRWPVSGEGADTMFCGAQTERLYCPSCSKIAYRPTAKT